MNDANGALDELGEHFATVPRSLEIKARPRCPGGCRSREMAGSSEADSAAVICHGCGNWVCLCCGTAPAPLAWWICKPCGEAAAAEE